MGLSHVVFPDMYRAYYKMYRGELLPNTREKQIKDQNRILNEFIFTLGFVKYSVENKIIFQEDKLKTLQSLPLVGYEEIYPFIERVLNGEEDVLWFGKPEWFSKSSGTTNARSKYIPVTNESIEQNHFLAGRDMLASYLVRNPESKLGFDSVVTISGSIQEESVGGAKIGDISAVIDKNSPWWARLSKALPKSILEIKSWDERLPKAVDYILNEDIKAFAGVTSWVFTIIDEAVKKSKKENANLLWPNIEVLFHGGVSIEPYRSVLKKLLPKDSIYFVEIFNASEGFYAFQDTDDENSGMLLLCGHGIFYEFLDLEDQKVFTLENIIVGKKYELIITTVSGLWRYKTGDVVMIVSLDPVRVKVVGRTKAVLNTFGEELMVGNVDSVISKLQNEGFEVGEYTGTTIYKSEFQNGGHEWVIEVEGDFDKNIFIEKFDSYLREINSDYDAKRKGDIILQKPKIHFVKRGTFYKWMQYRGKTGGQNKIPRLSEKRDLFENLMEFISL